jgi:hypothetical protein
MKQFLLILIFLIISIPFVRSQSGDTLLLKDGDKLIVKLVHIEKEKVKYKKLTNIDGPTYSLSSAEITSITLSSGDKLINSNNRLIDPKSKNNSPNPVVGNKNENLSNENDSKKSMRVKKSLRYNSRKNLISYNYASLITLNIEFAYERIIDKVGYFGLKIPIIFNMGVKTDYLDKRNIFTSGIQANIYPFGQSRIAYFTGPIIHFKIMEDNDYISTSGNNSVQIDIDPLKSTYLGFYMNNGVLFRAAPFLSFGVSMGFGIRRDIGRPEENSKFDIIGEGSISYRF